MGHSEDAPALAVRIVCGGSSRAGVTENLVISAGHLASEAANRRIRRFASRALLAFTRRESGYRLVNSTAKSSPAIRDQERVVQVVELVGGVGRRVVQPPAQQGEEGAG